MFTKMHNPLHFLQCFFHKKDDILPSKKKLRNKKMLFPMDLNILTFPSKTIVVALETIIMFV